MTAEPEAPTYLGDGVYVVRTQWDVELYTHNGVTATNRIYLDGVVLAAFLEYLRREGFRCPRGTTRQPAETKGNTT
jgi:hypothetical protein